MPTFVDEGIDAEMTSSWPLDATNSTSRDGRVERRVRISSSQHTMPPPRSLAQVYQPLRGVMITSGGSPRSRPAMLAVTLYADAVVRCTCATTRTAAPSLARSASHVPSSLETCTTGGPNGAVNESALLGQSPGRPPRVTPTSAV